MSDAPPTTLDPRPTTARWGGPRTYFAVSLLLWVVVDFGTAGGFRPSYFATYMPTLLVFYLGYPAVFTYLVFRRRVGTRGLMAATLIAVFVIEVLFAHNPWLTVPPLLFVGIPLAIAVYAPLTYFPLWIVRGEWRRHRRVVVPLCLVEILIVTITTLGTAG